ncbi:hypothetical protein M569_13037 [Genlisea aurea]|uniref:Glycosyl transferase 64 domain-containing protein n=1 Tax=Genlisea aurea TaxID=192259 RepID=S8C4X4_9LAMI|nr:hypothetical protein M569_13037 [Genlisea aurea]
MSTLIAIREGSLNGNGGDCSPAKLKASNRGRLAVLHRRLLLLVGGAMFNLMLLFFILGSLYTLSSRISPLMGWHPDYPSFVVSGNRSGYTVLINTWKRYSLLKQSVAHYSSCRGVDAVHVVWSETHPPSHQLRECLANVVRQNSRADEKPHLRFNLNQEDNLNNRFKPIVDLRTDAIFSVDDDVIVPCDTLDFAFAVWKTAPSTMVGFVPRMHWLDNKKDGEVHYSYGGWWSVWWTGTYSMVLSKAAFFHNKYLEMYTNQTPSSVHHYVTRERNCEDIAMSFVVANATGAPPVWVKGKIYEIGSSGISSLSEHDYKRNKCLNDFASLFGTMPLISSNAKAVNAMAEWLW